MPMPGTIGGAKLVFKEDEMKNFSVALDVKFLFDVDAENMDEAVSKARQFFRTMKHQWGNNPDVSWTDHYVVKQSAVEEVEYEID